VATMAASTSPSSAPTPTVGSSGGDCLCIINLFLW
jgi:hypothetical protein